MAISSSTFISLSPGKAALAKSVDKTIDDPWDAGAETMAFNVELVTAAFNRA